MAKFGPWSVRSLDDVAAAFRDLQAGLYKLGSENLNTPWMKYEATIITEDPTMVIDIIEQTFIYRRMGNSVEFEMMVAFNLTGAPKKEINISLPIAPRSEFLVFPCAIKYASGNGRLGRAVYEATDEQINAWHGDSSYWYISDLCKFWINGRYAIEG